MSYRVATADRAGSALELKCADWADCVATVRRVAAKYPDDHVTAYNNDKVDYDTDGLTWEEWAEVVDAIAEARGR